MRRVEVLVASLLWSTLSAASDIRDSNVRALLPNTSGSLNPSLSP